MLCSVLFVFPFDFWVISVDLSSSLLIVSLAVLILFMSLWRDISSLIPDFYIYNISGFLFLTASNSAEICHVHVVHFFYKRFSHINPSLIVVRSESDSVDSLASLYCIPSPPFAFCVFCNF